MRIVVMSDSHGHVDRLARIFEKHPEANWYVFLGDGQRDWEEVIARYPERHTLAVAGNCDWSGDLPLMREEKCGGKRVFFTHGHLYKVKYDLYTLTCAARERGADVVLFGHTHQPLDCYDDGLTLVNPGSVRENGAYALMDLGSHGVLTSLCRI